MVNRKTLAQLKAAAARRGMDVEGYAPGDGKTRFRFFALPVPADQDYFGPKSSIYTALGPKEAWNYLGLDAPKKRR